MAAIALNDAFQVNTTTSGHQSNPAIASDALGNFVVVWDGGGDGSDTGVFAQRYNSQGIAIGTEFVVNTDTTGNQNRADIAMNATGEFVVTWQSEEDGDGRSIVAQRYSQEGTALGTEIQVNTTTTGNQDDPAIAITASGDFVVTWQSLDGDGNGIVAQRYDADGNPVGNEFLVNEVTTGDQTSPAIAMDADGNFVVTWDSLVSANNTEIFARRYDSQGNPLGSVLSVSSSTNEMSENPAIAMNADGTFVVTWLESSGSELYLQKYDTEGVPVGNAIEVFSDSKLDQPIENVTVAIDADGDLIVSWSASLANDQGTSSSESLYVARYDDRGNLIDTVRLDGESSGDRYAHPAVSMQPDGNFVVAWAYGNDLIPTEGLDIYSRAYRVTDIKGTDNDDTLVGTQEDETFLGYKGKDTISGRNGDDVIYGGQGGDVLNGGRGDDTLEGRVGRDTIEGGGGNDWILGGDGRDQLLGNSGHDRLYGEDGNDVLDGGAGNDLLAGNPGRNQATGGKGDDRFLLESFSQPSLLIIKDFEDGTDKLARTSAGLAFKNLDIFQQGNHTMIEVDGNQIAKLLNFNAEDLKANDIVRL